jgi:hypothetical protein
MGPAHSHPGRLQHVYFRSEQIQSLESLKLSDQTLRRVEFLKGPAAEKEARLDLDTQSRNSGLRCPGTN